MNNINTGRNEFKEKPKPPKQLKSISRKEKDSEKNRSKQQLKNYVQSNFEDDNFEDNFMR
jgi:hypothetical protein|tara:strand:+ start:3759 stop:3938 length:180 start_codon:yes stop_codon:yes gene_type:complete